MPNSPHPKTAKEKWLKALHLCNSHPVAYWSISLLHFIVIETFINGRNKTYFGETLREHVGLSVHDGINLFLLLIGLLLLSLLIERIDENHRHVISDFATSLHKAWRRLLDIAVALFTALFSAATILLPLILLAIYPKSNALIEHLLSLPIMASPWMSNLTAFTALTACGLLASYGLNRTIYSPIIAAIHGSPGIQSTRSSICVTAGQWTNGLKVVWGPFCIIALSTYSLLLHLTNSVHLAIGLCYAIVLPLFFSVLIVELHSMLRQHNTNLEKITKHAPNAW